MKTTNNSVSKKNNFIGTSILVLSGLLAMTRGGAPDPKVLACASKLEAAGILLPLDGRQETNVALSSASFRRFKRLAKTDAGAATVIELANKFRLRAKEIAAYKTGQALEATVSNEATRNLVSDEPVEAIDTDFNIDSAYAAI